MLGPVALIYFHLAIARKVLREWGYLSMVAQPLDPKKALVAILAQKADPKARVQI